MTDSITTIDGRRDASHHGPEQIAPITRTSESPTSQETPDAIEQQVLQQRVRNSVRQPRLPRTGQVTWVRASDVLSGASGRVAGHGIRLTHAVHRPTQALKPLVQREREVGDTIRSDRASRLAPLGAYGANRDVRGAAMSLHR